MSKHTPGPWEIQTTTGLQIYITQPQNILNRKPGFYAEVRRFTTNVDEVKANANLIAAAPDLLEACEIALASDDRNVQHVLRSAIAKAKGETE